MKKKVLMLLFGTLDPDPRVWKEANSLSKGNYQITVVAPAISGKKGIYREDGFIIARILSYSPSIMRPLKRIRATFELIIFCLKKRYDIYHCHDASTLPFGFLFAKLYKKKLIYDAHEFFPDLFIERPDFKILQKIKFRISKFLNRNLPEKCFIKRINGMITVNRSLARLYKKYYKIEKEIIYLWNVPYINNFEKKDLYTFFGLNSNIPIILYEGSLNFYVNLETVLMILSKLKNPFYFVLLGEFDKQFEKEFFSLAESLKIKNKIYYTLFPYKELIPYISTATVGLFFAKPIFLSFKYSLPNKIFDYLVAGLPIIASDLPEISKLIKKYNLGIIIDPSDVEKSAFEIDYLLTDKRRYNIFKNNILAHKRLFSWEIQEKKLLNFYNKLSN